MLGRYILVRPFLADGQGTHLQLNQRGDAAVQEQSYPDYEDNANDVAHTHHRAIATSTGAWSRTSSGSAPISAAPAAIKTTSGRVRRIRFINKNAANGHWGLVANANAAITGATAPVDRVWVPPASATAPGVGVIDYGDAGIYFSTGIAIAPSTGADTYAALGAADSHYTIDWI